MKDHRSFPWWDHRGIVNGGTVTTTSCVQWEGTCSQSCEHNGSYCGTLGIEVIIIDGRNA